MRWDTIIGTMLLMPAEVHHLRNIEADYFSGYVMAKLGATLNEARAAMDQIASPRQQHTPWKSRPLKCHCPGWDYATGTMSNNHACSATTAKSAASFQRRQLDLSFTLWK